MIVHAPYLLIFVNMSVDETINMEWFGFIQFYFSSEPQEEEHETLKYLEHHKLAPPEAVTARARMGVGDGRLNWVGWS